MNLLDSQDQTENILKGQTEISGVVLEWIIDTRHGNVTISLPYPTGDTS